MLLDQGHGLQAVLALTHHGHLGKALQQVSKLVPCRFFVIHNYGIHVHDSLHAPKPHASIRIRADQGNRRPPAVAQKANLSPISQRPIIMNHQYSVTYWYERTMRPAVQFCSDPARAPLHRSSGRGPSFLPSTASIVENILLDWPANCPIFHALAQRSQPYVSVETAWFVRGPSSCAIPCRSRRPASHIARNVANAVPLCLFCSRFADFPLAGGIFSELASTLQHQPLRLLRSAANAALGKYRAGRAGNSPRRALARRRSADALSSGLVSATGAGLGRGPLRAEATPIC